MFVIAIVIDKTLREARTSQSANARNDMPKSQFDLIPIDSYHNRGTFAKRARICERVRRRSASGRSGRSSPTVHAANTRPSIAYVRLAMIDADQPALAAVECTRSCHTHTQWPALSPLTAVGAKSSRHRGAMVADGTRHEPNAESGYDCRCGRRAATTTARAPRRSTRKDAGWKMYVCVRLTQQRRARKTKTHSASVSLPLTIFRWIALALRGRRIAHYNSNTDGSHSGIALRMWSLKAVVAVIEQITYAPRP